MAHFFMQQQDISTTGNNVQIHNITDSQ